MPKRPRAALAVLALAAAAIFVLPATPASAGTQTYPNACRNSAVGTNWDQISVTLTSDSPASVAPGASFSTTNNSASSAIPGAIFVAGYNLGLLTVGSNTIPADVHAVIDAPNTTQLSQSTNTVSTTLTTVITDPDGVPGSGDESATDASTSVTFADMNWTAGASGTIDFHEHDDSAVTGVSGGGFIAVAHLAGGLINVQFHCTSGTVTGSNPGVPTFIPAPTVTSTQIQQPNQPPTANAGPDQTVNAGSLVTLDGTASSDPNGDPLTYSWSQTSGPSVTLSDPSSATPTFTAPSPGPATLTFDLTVCDPSNACSTDSVTINVVNQPPLANAGPDQSVTGGQTVTLDGSGSSDPENETLTYMWTQTAGTAVTLSDPTAVMPTFTAPNVNDTLTFQLQVCDPNACSTDSVNINVTAVVQAVFDASGQVIVNGPVKAGATAKTYVLKVTNTGNQTLTINPAAGDVTGEVDVNGTANGSVSSLTGAKTLSPGSSARFRLRWTGDPLPAGATVDFTACVHVAGDPTPGDDCGSVTRTT